MTTEAVNSFQSSKKLAADSVVGENTWEALDHALDAVGR